MGAHPDHSFSDPSLEIQELIDKFYLLTHQGNYKSVEYLEVDFDRGRVVSTPFRHKASNIEEVRFFIQRYLDEHAAEISAADARRLKTALERWEEHQKSRFFRLLFRIKKWMQQDNKHEDKTFEEAADYIRKTFPHLLIIYEEEIRGLNKKDLQDYCEVIEELKSKYTYDALNFFSELVIRYRIGLARSCEILDLYVANSHLPQTPSTIRMLGAMSESGLQWFIKTVRHLLKPEESDPTSLIYLIEKRVNIVEQSYESALLENHLQLFIDGLVGIDDELVAEVVYNFPKLKEEKYRPALEKVRHLPIVSLNKLLELCFRCSGSTEKHRGAIRRTLQGLLEGLSMDQAMSKAGLEEIPYLENKPIFLK